MGQFDRHRYQISTILVQLFAQMNGNSECPPHPFRTDFRMVERASFRREPSLARGAAQRGSFDPTSAQVTLKQEYSAENRVDRLAYQGRTPSP